MYPFWKSNFGKLIVGGCGLQVGAILTLGMLVAALSFCAICAVTGVFSSGVRPPIARSSPTRPPDPAPSPEAELVLLRQKIDLLAGRVTSLRTNVPAIPPAPTATPVPPPKAIVLADKSAVNLRSGPGTHYVRLGRLPLGNSLELVGRNNDSSWWLVTSPDGSVAWVSAMVVTAFNLDETALPVVSIPALLVQPTAARASGTISDTIIATPAVEAALPGPLPAGTPTAAANRSRRFVQDTMGYKQLIRRLLLPTVSESFSPEGDRIAITEKIKLYTIGVEGAAGRVLLEDDDNYDLVGGAVWSPDGEFIAFRANRRDDCEPCHGVGLVRLADGAVTYLEPPPGLGLDFPRWTQDGRLLVNAHPGRPAEGTVYVYDTAGQGQVAEGRYLLSSSHAGQKWFPWQPGKIWQADPSEPVDSYYRD